MSAIAELDVSGGMRDDTFRHFQQYTLDITGIELDSSKQAMLINRLARRINVIGSMSFEQYLDLVQAPNSPEYQNYIDTITTNLTYFYRELHHFEFLLKHALPELEHQASAGQALRIWSAGCSYGQEPYSLAITIRQCADLAQRPVRILGTDLNLDAVNHASFGAYSKEQLRGLPGNIRAQWFMQRVDGIWVAKPALQSAIAFKCLNLFHEWPFKPGVDVIFCRNVLIYFPQNKQNVLLEKFADYQNPGGFLFIGHSETNAHIYKYYKRVDNTVYQRV